MIQPGEPLPTRKRMTLEGSIFDYYDHDTFAVSYRHTPRDIPCWDQDSRSYQYAQGKGETDDHTRNHRN